MFPPVNLTSWREKIERDSAALLSAAGREEDQEEKEDDESDVVVAQQVTDAELGVPSRERYKDGVLSIGCLGEMCSGYMYAKHPITHWGKYWLLG